MNYYTEELTAIRFRTMKTMFAQMAPGYIAFPLAAYFRMRGILGWRPRPSYGTGGVGSARQVARNQLPSRAVALFAPLLEQLDDLGFETLAYRLGDNIGTKQSAATLLLDQTQTVFAIVEWVAIQGAPDQTPVEFDSYFEGDPDVLTAATSAQNLALTDAFQLDFVDQMYVADEIRLERLYSKHRLRIASRGPRIFAREVALQEHDHRSQRRFDAMLKKGLLRVLTTRELKRIKAGGEAC